MLLGWEVARNQLVLGTCLQNSFAVASGVCQLYWSVMGMDRVQLSSFICMYLESSQMNCAYDSVGRWTGHVIRMEDQRIPKQLLFGELEQGHRRQGRPCKRFKDTVKAGLQWCDIPPTELVATALDRQRWRTLSQSASSALEEERRHQAQSARERRHLAACIPATNANFQCPDCARLCKSRIGLQNHSRTHR